VSILSLRPISNADRSVIGADFHATGSGPLLYITSRGNMCKGWAWFTIYLTTGYHDR